MGWVLIVGVARPHAARGREPLPVVSVKHLIVFASVTSYHPRKSPRFVMADNFSRKIPGSVVDSPPTVAMV
jgi:hypothetical protein